MKKSIYTRYYYLTMLTSIFCCALVGCILLLWANRMHYNRSNEEMRSISRLMIADTGAAYAAEQVDMESIQKNFDYYALTYSVSCYLFDQEGNCVIRTDHASEPLRLSQAMMENVQRVPSFEVADLFGNADGLNACYVEQFCLNGEKTVDNYYIALIFPAEQLTGYVEELFVVLMIALIGISLFVACVYYFNTRRLLKPITEITKAAEQYADGNFSYKLDDSGTGELHYLAGTMNRMAEFINSNEQNRKSFVSNVSHELRTPMTTIGGFVDGMLDGTIPAKEQKSYLSRISAEIKRLSRLVNSMLNISKFEEGEMELNRVNLDITAVLISTLFMFEQKIEAKSVTVKGLEDCGRMEIYADKDLMQQVFYNLIENAVKFVDNKGALSFAMEREDKILNIHIRNSGEGLTEEEISKVFDRFYKTDASRGKDTTGVGLGLSIVSRIIRLHGGTVMVKSIKGEYTEFVLRLPVKGKRLA